MLALIYDDSMTVYGILYTVCVPLTRWQLNCFFFYLIIECGEHIFLVVLLQEEYYIWQQYCRNVWNEQNFRTLTNMIYCTIISSLMLTNRLPTFCFDFCETTE